MGGFDEDEDEEEVVVVVAEELAEEVVSLAVLPVDAVVVDVDWAADGRTSAPGPPERRCRDGPEIKNDGLNLMMLLTILQTFGFYRKDEGAVAGSCGLARSAVLSL